MNINKYPGQVPQSSPVKGNPQVGPQKSSTVNTSFAQVLQDMLPKQEPVKFSAHAMQRLQDRRIELEAGDLQRISQAVHTAEKKGARSSLLLYQDLALIASVKSKTIVTAMSGDDLREHVFTNIDSAVIIK